MVSLLLFLTSHLVEYNAADLGNGPLVTDQRRLCRVLRQILGPVVQYKRHVANVQQPFKIIFFFNYHQVSLHCLVAE